MREPMRDRARRTGAGDQDVPFAAQHQPGDFDRGIVELP